MLVPMRFLTENLGYTVDLDGNAGIARVRRISRGKINFIQNKKGFLFIIEKETFFIGGDNRIRICDLLHVKQAL